MRVVMVWTEYRVSNLDLRRFAERLGGKWNDAVGDEAVIARGDGAVYIGVITDAADALPDDVEFARDQLGKTPASMLSVRVGNTDASMALAHNVAAAAINEWGGFLDDNEPV